MEASEVTEVTEKIIGCAMRVHSVLGTGFLESVYEKVLAHEVQKAGLAVQCQLPLQVFYDGIAVENKAVQTLTPTHEVQLVNYLTATQIEIGLLLSFGAASLQFKRKHRTYRPLGTNLA